MPSAGPCHTALRRVRVAPAVLVVLLALLTLPGLATAAPGLAAGGPLPLAFEANHGQADGSVKFLTRGRGYVLFLTPTETVLVLVPGDLRSPLARRPGQTTGGVSAPPSVVRMRFVGGDASAAIVGEAFPANQTPRTVIISLAIDDTAVLKIIDNENTVQFPA